jgi:hypothetical protein
LLKAATSFERLLTEHSRADSSLSHQIKMLNFCVRRRRRPKSRHNRRHVRTRAATTIATAAKINNRSLNFQARQQCLRLQLSPATHVCGAPYLTRNTASLRGIDKRCCIVGGFEAQKNWIKSKESRYFVKRHLFLYDLNCSRFQ